MGTYQQPQRRRLSVPSLLLGMAIGVVSGSATVAVGIRVAGYKVVDRDTAETIEKLRAWAKDPETDRKMREATDRLNKSSKDLEEFSKRLKQTPPVIPPPPDGGR